jgi:hypothetical protein
VPFTSRRQARKCYALRGRGKAKGWDCDEWSDHTDFEKLPARKKAGAAPTFIDKIAAHAARITIARYGGT